MELYLQDTHFLQKLNEYRNKTFYVKIIVMDMQENYISEIQGRVATGSSINIDGSSSMRRSANINFIAEETENDLADIDNLLSINKKVKLLVGVENVIDNKYPEILWFNQGIYVIVNPSLTHSTTSVTISLSLKDKMALLNGDCAGKLPSSITFDSYDQLDEEGKRTNVKQFIYDIVQTAVMNYGGESESNIIINDLPKRFKSIVWWTGSQTLYFNGTSYSLKRRGNDERIFEYGDEVGYQMTDFLYGESLITGIGDSVTSVLDKVVSYLGGNYEYFYNVDGQFIFQEKKNYINTTYNEARRLSELPSGVRHDITDNVYVLLDSENYQVNFNTSNGGNVYVFTEGNGLISSYSNSPNYQNIKNDFHLWGKTKTGFALHYHLAIKSKPKIFNTYKVIKNEDGTVRLVSNNSKEDNVEDYIPNDWRAELYMQGLTKLQKQLRPDIYEQELLDFFDSIYNMAEQKWKTDIVLTPNELSYFIDYLEPTDEIHSYSVDSIGPKIFSKQEDKIKKLYNMDIPNYILIDVNNDIFKSQSKEEYKTFTDEAKAKGYSICNITDENIIKGLAIGSSGYTGQEVMRDMLYQYTTYSEGINITCVPMFNLEPNTRIKVNDLTSNIRGDYIIKSMSLPLNGNFMTISATSVGSREMAGDEQKDKIDNIYFENNALLITSENNILHFDNEDIDNDEEQDLLSEDKTRQITDFDISHHSFDIKNSKSL